MLVAAAADDDLNLNYLVLAAVESPLPQPPVLTRPTLSGGDLSVSFQSEAAFAYTLEVRERLGDPAGQQLLLAVSGDGTVKTISRPYSSATGFYRLVAR